MEKNLSTVKTGKRKSAIANVMLFLGKGNIIINNREISDYIHYNPKMTKIIQQPLTLLEVENKYDIIVKAKGGGLKGQSEAIKLAISKALYEIVEDKEQKLLKKNGLLTRSSLCKERRKYGLKKARKASQFSKR